MAVDGQTRSGTPLMAVHLKHFMLTCVLKVLEEYCFI